MSPEDREKNLELLKEITLVIVKDCVVNTVHLQAGDTMKVIDLVKFRPLKQWFLFKVSNGELFDASGNEVAGLIYDFKIDIRTD